MGQQGDFGEQRAPIIATESRDYRVRVRERKRERERERERRGKKNNECNIRRLPPRAMLNLMIVLEIARHLSYTP